MDVIDSLRTKIEYATEKQRDKHVVPVEDLRAYLAEIERLRPNRNSRPMDDQIRELIDKLSAGCVQQFVGDGSDNFEVDEAKTDRTMVEAAVILRAIFDFENQPSQFGTILSP